jgi:hypothetical protein
MFRARHVAFSLAILGVSASLRIDFAHARGQALYRQIHHASARGKASALVRMVDENPEGRRP